MSGITANDLKTRGIAAIEEALNGRPEAIVSVRGADRYVVMALSQYHYLRECELEAALAQSRADVDAGRYVKESAQAHVERALGKSANKPPPRPAKANAATNAATNTATNAATRKRPGVGKRPAAKTGKVAVR